MKTRLELQDKVMLAMNGPGDSAKLSRAQAEQLRKTTLAKAVEAKKAALEKKTAKVISMKKPLAKTKAGPVKKAAASKKVVRKTMKPNKKKR
jgi:hypothetical protein